MKNHNLIIQIAMFVAMVMTPLAASALSGHYDDPGGGQYWCKVWVYSTTAGKSFQSLTGESEDAAMGKMRGFKSEHNGTISTEYPTIKFWLHYHHAQGGDFEYNSSKTRFYVMTRDGLLHKIGELPRYSWNLTQTDYTYGVLQLEGHDSNWMSVRYAPSSQGIASVTAFQIENESYYHEDNFLSSDNDITISSIYLRGLTMDISKAHEASVKWISPTKVKVEADNSWLPEEIGKGMQDFQYSTNYDITAFTLINGGIRDPYSQKSLQVTGRGNGSVELDVPLEEDFYIGMYRDTKTSFKFNNQNMSQDLNEHVWTQIPFHNKKPDIWVSFNQVKGEMTLNWSNPGREVLAEGDYQVYRTLLTGENGPPAGNRELIGTTSTSSFTDNLTRGLEYSKTYRYEVFQLKKSWDPITIPTNPEQPLNMVNAGDFIVTTAPVIPIHLTRDETVTDKIKFDWDFGNIPNVENDLTFKVHRIEPGGNISQNYMVVNVPRTAGKASFVDEKPQSVCDIYGYFVQLDILDNKVHIYSDTVQAHLLEGTRVTSMEASKGVSGNNVKIDWTAHHVGTAKTLFTIMRRMIGGSTEWVKVGQVSGTEESYTFTDETIEPGRYYQYKVNAYIPDCDNEGQVVNNSMADTGFGQSHGVVSGRVSFDTGTAVPDVHITLERDGDEINQAKLYSRHILEDGEGLEWHTNATTANAMLRLDKPFTLQMWVNPDPGHNRMRIFGIDNYDCATTGDNDTPTGYNFFLTPFAQGNVSGYAVAMQIKGALTWFTGANSGFPVLLPAGAFSHITLRNNGNGSIDCIVNGNNDEHHTIRANNPDPFDYSDITAAPDGKVRVQFFNKKEGGMAGYQGYADEVRVWNRALTDEEIKGNYDRLLSGRDNGMKLYWTFDEGLEEYAYDYSRTNGYPNGNHAVIGNNTRPSLMVPTGDQLACYGITNDKGEYEIRGIPFTGSGTRYSVYPTKGIHSFTPTSRSAFIGGSSLTVNNVDFTDVSSFKVTGTILYAGTTIPVDSVNFYIDGKPCNKNDKLIVSDENGNYEISVPIGSHYIEARRAGHVFANNGRYPATEGNTYEFFENTHIDFTDNTTVVIAGRITGGCTEGEKPLGYGVSANNIGAATIKLSALDHPQRMLNAIEHVDGVTHEWVPNPNNVPLESTSTNINSSGYIAGGTIDDVKYLYITTDAATGEFSARVPPLRYMVESVKFPKNPNVENDELFKNIPAVNLTNPRDTVIPDTVFINKEKKDYLPLFKCNKKLMLTYRSNPVLEITQQGLPAGAFGEEKLKVTEQEQEIELPLYTHNETTGEVTYNYNYPIFLQRKQYKFNVLGYEPYTNYDTSPTGKLYKDVLRDSVVTFANELGGDAYVVAQDQTVEGHEVKRGQMIKLESGQVQLDSVGKATYTWIAGFPSLTAPYTRTINATTVINGQTKTWLPKGLSAVVSGVLTTGNNFITAGPSYVQMVLRDPPGDASTTSWQVDTIKTEYNYTVRGIHHGGETSVNYGGPVEVDVVTGTLCFAKITYNTIVHENAAWGKYEWSKSIDDRTYTTYTNTHTTSTSPLHWQVGRDGDVFIGYSTNYIIGSAEKVGLFKQEDGSWGIGRDEVINMDEKFETHFNYSQVYIETILFDNIKRTRNAKLVHVNSMSEILDNPSKPTYYTFLSKDDPKYGTSNDDKEVWGDQAQSDATAATQPSYYFRYPEGYEGCDSVRWCNEMIKLWKNVLAENEKDKLDAFANQAKYFKGNESFETGTTVTHSSGTNTRTQNNWITSFSTTAGYKGKHGYLLDKAGLTFDIKIGAGIHWTDYEVDETNVTDKFTYTFNDTQRDNAHTVDVYESPKGWGPIFRTRGGQTRCPYEGATYTKYYNPGAQLDYATMRSDNPKISMPVINFDGIPAGQSVPVDIVLTNQSETHDPYIACMLYANPNQNLNGLIIKLDDKTIFNGTEIWLEYNKPLTQTLIVKQSDPSVLDYENVELSVYSDCAGLDDPQSVLGGAVEIDKVRFSVHFVPAAPDVTLKLDKTILNQRAVASGEEITATISDINRQFSGLKGVRLKYRFAGNDKWITAHEWFTDPKYLEGGQESETQSMLSNEHPNITYTLKLPNIDGNYVVAAESMAMFDNDEVVKTTAEQTVIRDTRGPKLLGQAYPNTGILTPTSDIHIKFNEAIRESYLTKESNFFITGQLNDSQLSHDVSLQFNGNPVMTDAYLPIANTSFASSLWLKRKSGGTIIEHGTEGNMLKVSVNEQGQVEANINGTTVTSQESIPKDKWVFLAMNYVKGSADAQNTLTMLMAEGGNEKMLFEEVIVPDYNSTGRLVMGRDFTGMMHEFVLWNKNTPVRTLLAQRDEVVAPYLPGLVGYWKMNEGYGTTVTDYARSRNMHLAAESWNIENTNLGAHLDGEHTIKIPIGNISPRPADSYVIETWFRGEKDKNARATLLSVTDRMSIGFDYDNSMMLHIYNDTMPSTTTNGVPIVLSSTNYNDGSWHHLAMNVHRGVSAVVYIDGKAVKTLSEQQLPTPAGDFLYVGSIVKRNADTQNLEETFKFTGDIDDMRVWNIATDGTSIVANRYNQVDTTGITDGLLVYCPMERSVLDANNNIVTEFSVSNIAPLALKYGTDAVVATDVTQAVTAPSLRKAPLKQNLDFDYTASDKEIFINLNTLPARMQGNLLTFVVKNVRDLCDNLSEPITWSAVVDYNTLLWDVQEVEIFKTRLDQATAKVMLQNKGRDNNRFNITGLPSWITASETTGVLGTNESIPISFTIGATAPVGTHHVYVYAVNDDEICSPLMLHITVIGNEPDWTVDPDQFESSMNVIGQIYFNDKICSNPSTMISAFVDDKCCGVASPKLMPSRDAYFVSMTIYGLEDITSEKPITFRIYDADQGVVYGNVLTTLNGKNLNLTYSPNNLVGDYDNPVMWKPTDQIDQLCRLLTGWNWISLYVQPEQGKNDLENVFGHSKVFNTIKGKEGFAMNNGTKWTSTGLETVGVGTLYKVKVKNDVDHNIVGTKIDTRTATQTIYPGWNWIGPLSIYNLSLEEAFADLQPTRGDIIKSKTQVAFYNGYKWEGDLTAMIPGLGYYYKSQGSQAVTFHYPTIDATTYQPPPMMMSAAASMPFTPADHHQFSDNMNVVARIVKGDVEVNDLCLAAFIDGECRGATYATDDGYYMLTVAGNADEAGKTVRFATIYGGEEVWFSEEMQWLSDWIYGDLDEPQLLDLNNSSGINNVISSSTITITPAVVTDVINVSAGDILKVVNVYSFDGKLLDSFTPEDNHATINLSHLIDGVYFVEARTYSGARAIKQILKR